MIKERYQNPVVGDVVKLKLFSYNSNNRRDFVGIEKIEIYYLDKNQVSSDNPDGRIWVTTIDGTEVQHDETGLYHVELPLVDEQFVIGDYIDIWHVNVDGNIYTTISNNFEVYNNLWMTTPIPIVYDFDFTFRPNKIRLGSKKYLIIDINPNVPTGNVLRNYYQNLAITCPVKINISLSECNPCVPAEKDLRVILKDKTVELREKMTGYYFLDTTDMQPGIYDVWFELEFGETKHISDINQLQIF